MSVDRLMSARGRLSATGEDVDATLARFQRDVDALGKPWGTGQVGEAIETIYLGALAMVMNCLVTNMDTVDAYGEWLASVANGIDTYRQTAERELHHVAEQARRA